MDESWPTTHATLIRQLKDWRDENVWKQFVDIYGPLLYRLCQRHQLQDADAADVVQNVLGRVSRAIGTFDRDRGRFRAWLITITSREIYRYRERVLNRAATSAGNEEVLLGIEKDLASEWEVELQVQLFEYALERTRSEFDELSWQTFRHIWIDKKRPALVAKDLGQSIQWVYQTKRKVFRRLNQEVESLKADGTLLAGDGNDSDGRPALPK